jgi:hypothetical protein
VTTVIPNRNPRARVSKQMRDAVFAAYGPYCHLCGEYVKHGDRTADHLTAVKAGGSTIAGSLRPAHKTCNEFRGARPLTAALKAECRTRYLALTQ